jgi:hypothetical protein
MSLDFFLIKVLGFGTKFLSYFNSFVIIKTALWISHIFKHSWIKSWINGRPKAEHDHGLPWSGFRETLSDLVKVSACIMSHTCEKKNEGKN